MIWQNMDANTNLKAEEMSEWFLDQVETSKFTFFFFFRNGNFFLALVKLKNIF